jgi:hypothetical protein
MDDAQVHARIEQLVAEEHDLWQREADGTATEVDRERLRRIEVQLDQTWDMLRRRRALRSVGSDPDLAGERGEGVVEGYEQ